MKYSIERTTQFKKDFKLAEKQGLNMNELEEVIRLLADGKALPLKYRDHELKGKYVGHRECHIEPDWLLIYKITEEVLILSLVRTGTHSRLFKM
ncbi:MAG: type II toxin-antitoxin system YafQ family toxin [Lachnospiraceae bacterium]|nr:type II toxin-antitoxin system YafQ family toxin [Lachnospiraceae bacterium]